MSRRKDDDRDSENSSAFADLFGEDEATRRIDSKAASPRRPKSGKRRVADSAVASSKAANGELDDDLPNTHRGEIKPDEFRDLRMGRIEPETRIDLHGLDQQQARHALRKAFGVAAASGRCCVAVIHGLGKGSATGEATLKNAVPGWLRSPPLDAWVRGFAPARPMHGGDGATYVLLRRSAKGGKNTNPRRNRP